jgi:hypothetical protein
MTEKSGLSGEDFESRASALARGRLVGEEIGPGVERAKVWIAQIKHKKQMSDAGC